MTSKSCRGRDATKLTEYIGKSAEQIQKLFAKALARDGYLSSFAGQVEASECIFSYPDSEWYGVYLLDSDGNKFWNGERNAMYYFKLNFYTPAGRKSPTDAFTKDGTTDITQTDLQGKKSCVINADGNCVLPLKEQAAPKRPPRAAAAAPPPVPQVDAAVMSKLQELSLNSSEGTRDEVTRDYFENVLKSKMLIIQWMIEHMKTEDIVGCIKKGTLNPADVRRAEEVAASAPEPGSSGGDEVEAAAVEAAAGLSEAQVRKMFKKITKEDLIKDLKEQFPDAGSRKQGIVELCRRAGKQLTIKETKRGPKLIDFDGEVVDDDTALEECAKFEAERIRQRLVSRWSSVMRKVSSAVKKGKMPEFRAEPMEDIVSSRTAQDIIDEVNQIEDPAARIQEIIRISEPYGYTTKPGKRGIQFYDAEGESATADDVLEEVAGLEIATMASVSFGKRRRKGSQQNRFAMAAKKCKGKSDFRKCMSKALRKSSFGKRAKSKKSSLPGVRRKYTSGGGRKSPGVSATLFAVGTVKTGLDGNQWVIKKASNGVKRWSKK